MGARKQIARTSTNSTLVKGKRFHLPSFCMSSKSSMRNAAKRFAETEKFDENVLWYEGKFENNRWSFIAVGKLNR